MNHVKKTIAISLILINCEGVAMLDDLLPGKINTDFNVTADLTPIAEGISDNLKAIAKSRTWDCVLGPLYAKAERKRRLLEAQTNQDVRAIELGELQYRNGELLPGPAVDAIAKTITTESIDNIIGCTMEAEKHLQALSAPEEEIPEEPVSQTFINRWRMEASCISEKDLQQIWGRILAEEMTTPKSISFKTFDIIKNFTSQDALIFTKACKFIVNSDALLYFGHDLSQDELNTLEEHGIIRFPQGFMPTFPCRHIRINGLLCQGFSCGNYEITVKAPSHSSEGLTFSGYSLTQSGIGLYKATCTVLESNLPSILNAIRESLPKINYSGIEYKMRVYQKGQKSHDFKEIEVSRNV